MTYTIEIQNVSKEYYDTRAVHDLSLSLHDNKIYGLLGRNGAGKTTLLHMLAGQSLPTSGLLSVSGEPIYENSNVLKQICFVPGFNKYFQNFKAKDFFATAKLFYSNWDQDFAESLIEQFELIEKKKLKEMSTGMLTMVSMIISLASRAPITLLDEPYTGLDASARQLFYDILAEDYSRYPRTIIFSTHLIDEASRLFEDVVLIDKGSLVFHMPIESIEEQSFTIHGNSDALQRLLAHKNIVHKETLGGLSSYSIFDSLSQSEYGQIIEAGLQVQKLSLQQLFVHLTTKRSVK